MSQAVWRVSVIVRGPDGSDGAVIAMLLFCNDIGGTISGYAIGQASVCVEVGVTEWSEQAAQNRVLAKTAAVIADGWTLELVAN